MKSWLKILVCSLLLNTACLPVVTPTQPPISGGPGAQCVATTNACAITVNLNVSGSPTSGSLTSDSGTSYPISFTLTGRASVTFPSTTPPNGWGATLTWGTNSERVYVGYTNGTLFAAGSQIEGGVSTVGWPTLDFTPPLPPVPSRDQLITAQETFQGLTLVCADYPAGVPVFDVMLDVLSPPCRQAFYAMKRAAGDQVIALAVSHAYLEAGIPAPISTGHDWSGDLVGFNTFLGEVVSNGFYVQLHLAGDGNSSACLTLGSGCFNDPVGWTYGQPWLVQNFPAIYAAVGQYNPYVRYVTGFDGVFYGWPPDAVTAFGARFRAIAPQGVLGIEHDTSHIPVGNGPADYAPGGAMRDYDFILGEFGGPSGDSTWQILGRMVRPYSRPADQPSGDDPNPPFYLGVSSARGPFYYNCFEFGLYQWVRQQITALQLSMQRLQFTTMGCKIVG